MKTSQNSDEAVICLSGRTSTPPWRMFMRKQEMPLCLATLVSVRARRSPQSATAPLAYVRFHGRNWRTWNLKGKTSAERFDWMYDREELEDARWFPSDAMPVGPARHSIAGWIIRNFAANGGM